MLTKLDRISDWLRKEMHRIHDDRHDDLLVEWLAGKTDLGRPIRKAFVAFVVNFEGLQDLDLLLAAFAKRGTEEWAARYGKVVRQQRDTIHDNIYGNHGDEEDLLDDWDVVYDWRNREFDF